MTPSRHVHKLSNLWRAGARAFSSVWTANLKRSAEEPNSAVLGEVPQMSAEDCSEHLRSKGVLS